MTHHLPHGTPGGHGGEFGFEGGGSHRSGNAGDASDLNMAAADTDPEPYRHNRPTLLHEALEGLGRDPINSDPSVAFTTLAAYPTLPGGMENSHTVKARNVIRDEWRRGRSRA